MAQFPPFWARFADTGVPCQLSVESQPEPELSTRGSTVSEKAQEFAAAVLDVSDLVLHLLHHATISGIQRVQIEILLNLESACPSMPVYFTVLSRQGGLFTIDKKDLLNALQDLGSGTLSREDIEYDLRGMLDRAVPCKLGPGDVLLEIGAFWNVNGMGALLREVRNAGALIGVLIHDLIPIVTPEYFETGSTSRFIRGVFEALSFADFILTTSEFNKTCIAGYMSSTFAPAPIQVVPLGHAFSRLTPEAPEVSSEVTEVLEKNYVLCVGTIEVRKNPSYLLNIWTMLLRSGRTDVPDLVFAGSQGWLIADFMQQLKACNFLGGRIIVLQGVTDVELALLYQNCLLTVFPSFVEGWGLPAGESLAHGRICICSAAGGIPEVGGDLLDYADPHNVRDGLEKLLMYIDNPERRRAREAEIAQRFKPRSWKEVAAAFVGSVNALARQVQPSKNVAAICLPPNRHMAISREVPAILMEGLDGRLSAELSCVSGWRPAGVSGVVAAEPAPMIRFRTAELPGTRINLVLQLAAHGRDYRLRIRSGSGTEADVTVTPAAEKLVSLSCAVEDGNLVTVHLLSLGATLAEEENPAASYWTLKGILYFNPRVAANGTVGGTATVQPAQPFAPLLPGAPEEQNDDLASREPIVLRAGGLGDMRRAASFGEFLHETNVYWSSTSDTERREPAFADEADLHAFHSGCGNSSNVPQLGLVRDAVRFIRRRDQFISMSRFSEGSVFDRLGVWKGFGYLQGSPARHTPWLLREADEQTADGEILASAPWYDGSYVIFYNGNLHNYYHWLIEGLLGLDVLTRALGIHHDLKIALPISMDIDALIDHRGSIPDIGLGAYQTVEAAADVIRVREAIWIDSDLVQTLPAPYLQDFQRRIQALYAGVRPRLGRRLLVARKGRTRRIRNIEEVEKYLAKEGFETVYLEGMSVRDQILLFQSAEFIISPHGAGLANLVFCEPGTKVIELMPVSEFRPFFWLISEKLGLVHGLHFCSLVGKREFQSDIQVDIGTLFGLIGKVEARDAR